MLSDDFHIPEVQITNQSSPTRTTNANFRLRIKARDSISKLDRINLYINDVPYFGTKGINLRPLNINDYEDDIDINLSKGTNKVQVSVLNQGGAESLKETFQIWYEGPDVKPNLYLITVGASDFQASDFDLK